MRTGRRLLSDPLPPVACPHLLSPPLNLTYPRPPPPIHGGHSYLPVRMTPLQWWHDMAVGLLSPARTRAHPHPVERAWQPGSTIECAVAPMTGATGMGRTSGASTRDVLAPPQPPFPLRERASTVETRLTWHDAFGPLRSCARAFVPPTRSALHCSGQPPQWCGWPSTAACKRPLAAWCQHQRTRQTSGRFRPAHPQLYYPQVYPSRAQVPKDTRVPITLASIYISIFEHRPCSDQR